MTGVQTWALPIWRGLAQTAEKYVHKGDKLYIEGKIKSRSYDDQNGIKRTIVEIFADNMEMLTPRGTAQSQGTAPASQAVQPQPMASSSADEDLPF